MEQQLRCEKCGCTDFKKVNGLYVCQFCGNKVSPQKIQPTSSPQGPQTGNPNNQTQSYPNDNVSGKSWLITLLLCIFLGMFGMHRFYAGKSGTGVIWFFTGGVLGIGWAFDFVMIVCGSFKDAHGDYIKRKKK